jgi:hypothetical protein
MAGAQLRGTDMTSQNDITIYWANKTEYNRHQVALDLQNACNPRALARELVKIVDAAANELNSTVAVWDDAAVILMINKLESMSRSDARYSAAYAVCHERTAK